MKRVQDAYFMMRAIELAELAIVRGQYPFGAVIVDADDEIIAEGHNNVRGDLDPSAHGEVVAIRAALKRLNSRSLTDCTLYTSCEPCLMCSYVIVQTGISRVVFAARATDVPNAKPLMDAALTQAAAWVNTQPDRQPIEVCGDVMRDRARAILDCYDWK